VHIPKGRGKTRPIGVSTIEDKIVQEAMREVLETIYEQDFEPCSFGFRPGRGAHDALRELNQIANYEGIQWVVEADIKSFFDSIPREKLKDLLKIRVADGSMIRLVGKCLHVGVLDGAEFSTPSEGTVQGSIISPLLGNVYLHYALDVWFQAELKLKLTGHARLVRYADDFVIGCSNREDAETVLAELHERMASFGLTLHPDKTGVIPFNRPKKGESLGNAATFDFLGFTMYWRRTRRGGWTMTMKTRKASLRKATVGIGDWCRRHRHLSREKQHAALARRLNGHYNYFGVNGNTASLKKFFTQTKRQWLKWLLRRSQRKRLTWEGFAQYLKAFPLPQPQVRVRIWGRSP
jgi:group II intron reverse transcriptase/maturase